VSAVHLALPWNESLSLNAKRKASAASTSDDSPSARCYICYISR